MHTIFTMCFYSAKVKTLDKRVPQWILSSWHAWVSYQFMLRGFILWVLLECARKVVITSGFLQACLRRDARLLHAHPDPSGNYLQHATFLPQLNLLPLLICKYTHLEHFTPSCRCGTGCDNKPYNWVQMCLICQPTPNNTQTAAQHSILLFSYCSFHIDVDMANFGKQNHTTSVLYLFSIITGAWLW